jgi:outer membrane protein OmpA-like peptidoglycan-associated protein
LREIAKKIKDLNGLVLIEGYTDNVGTAESNMKLSKNRANAVKDFLVENAEIDYKIIDTKALGQSNPVADNNTEE